jgi:hypothetical protein
MDNHNRFAATRHILDRINFSGPDFRPEPSIPPAHDRPVRR